MEREKNLVGEFCPQPVLLVGAFTVQRTSSISPHADHLAASLKGRAIHFGGNREITMSATPAFWQA